MSIAEAIIDLRLKRGELQEQFARAMGVSATTVSRWENGRNPDRSSLSKLAEMANAVSADHLADLFQAARRARIVARAENLSSPLAPRQIPVHELASWVEWQTNIYNIAEELRKRLTPGKDNPIPSDIEKLKQLFEELRVHALFISVTAGNTAAEIQLHQNPTNPLRWPALSEQVRRALSKNDPEKTKADIQRMQRELDELWGRQTVEEPQQPTDINKNPDEDTKQE